MFMGGVSSRQRRKCGETEVGENTKREPKIAISVGRGGKGSGTNKSDLFVLAAVLYFRDRFIIGL